MSWRRRREELVRRIKSTIEWCDQRRTPKGGASRLREVKRLLRKALANEDSDKLLDALGLLSRYLDEIR